MESLCSAIIAPLVNREYTRIHANEPFTDLVLAYRFHSSSAAPKFTINPSGSFVALEKSPAQRIKNRDRRPDNTIHFLFVD